MVNVRNFNSNPTGIQRAGAVDAPVNNSSTAVRQTRLRNPNASLGLDRPAQGQQISNPAAATAFQATAVGNGQPSATIAPAAGQSAEGATAQNGNPAVLEGIKALLGVEQLSPGDMMALQQLYQEIGPDIPADTVAIDVPTSDPALQGKVKKFADGEGDRVDEAHAGRITVPNSNGGSIAFKELMSQPNPLQFAKDHLAYGDKDNGENIFFGPGLNTVHEPTPGETTTGQRLEHYANVLGGIKQTQMHLGTSMDQGPAEVNISQSPVLQTLLDTRGEALAEAGLAPQISADGTAVWHPRQIDRLQAALSIQGAIQTPFKTNIKALLAKTGEPNAEPIVLQGYSRSSLEMDAAVREHIQESAAKGEPMADIQARLRDKVTIVTIGNASRTWADGPAYLHLSSKYDPLTESSGVSFAQQKGAGSDAIFLGGGTPYQVEDNFDNHNYGALTSQYMSALMALNDATGFREVFDKTHAGQMNFGTEYTNFNGQDRPLIDHLTNAMITMTNGSQWLWDPDAAWEGVPYGALPGYDAAENFLREQLTAAIGAEKANAFVDDVKQRFPQS